LRPGAFGRFGVFQNWHRRSPTEAGLTVEVRRGAPHRTGVNEPNKMN
jgi:hypothetical protein